MEKIKSKNELIQRIKTSRRELEEIIDSIPPNRLADPGVENNWSIKDVLAHISKWERMMCEWIRDLQGGITPDRPPPGEPWEDLDQINAAIYEKNRNVALSRVQAEFQSSHSGTLELVESTPEKDLLEPGRFEWTKNNPVWYLVGGNTFWHYEEHITSIRGWIENQVGENNGQATSSVS